MPGIIRTTVNGPWWNENSVTNCWRNEKPFTTSGALRGDYLTMRAGSLSGLGMLSSEERAIFRADADRYGKMLFVIWSYETPIAWRCGEYTYTSPAKYSVTTSKHQGRIF
jgi:hypothetical protein